MNGRGANKPEMVAGDLADDLPPHDLMRAGWA